MREDFAASGARTVERFLGECPNHEIRVRDIYRITSYNVCYTKLLRIVTVYYDSDEVGGLYGTFGRNNFV